MSLQMCLTRKVNHDITCRQPYYRNAILQNILELQLPLPVLQAGKTVFVLRKLFETGQ